MYVRMKQRKEQKGLACLIKGSVVQWMDIRKGPDMQQQRAEQSRTAYDMYVIDGLGVIQSNGNTQYNTCTAPDLLMPDTTQKSMQSRAYACTSTNMETWSPS
ncbi:hypothetical protein H0G86_011699 [Trichoderma simmonsii]|uniref:Uncharacterized protein n=1 Tax=Trichoderma simmonsii TaxID=1491479 RepID=A0A8G0LS08_9HYPO|nr:hypothetical protein H0G86_011699 [Trichoderma simmonsii]